MPDAVSDSSPLIHLAKIEALELISRLYSRSQKWRALSETGRIKAEHVTPLDSGSFKALALQKWMGESLTGSASSSACQRWN
jgi:hypothetical protein